MITLDDVRRLALALPETEEHTHYRLPAFQVGGATFAVVKPGKARVLLHVSESDAQSMIAKEPGVFELERPGRPFGVWVDLAQVDPDQLEDLIRLAWRTKAKPRE
jgi:hypothetical protein